jgi:hypothetical protein
MSIVWESTGPIEVFYCYAREDEVLRDTLEKHLRILKRQGYIVSWYDRMISAGKEWAREIDAHLNTARIILLLISPDFMDSDYCYSVEMQRALERYKQGETRVIPIILRPVDLEGTPIATLRALPTSGKPITSWSNRDAAFADVSKGIREVIQELKASSAPTPLFFTEKNESNVGSDTSLQDSASPTNKIRSSYYKTIDTNEVVARFQHLMQPSSHIRMLRLVGETKMGKSHLLAKVFPSIVEQDDGTRHAILDMRNRMHTVPDILDMACSSLGLEKFGFYSAAHCEWNSKLRGKTRRSQPNQGTEQSISEHTQARDRDLTLQFVKDLFKLDDKFLLFLFDSVSNANDYMQSWLANIFLPHVSRIVHVRTVVAGRSLPDPDSSYAICCEDYRLQAITNVDDYVNYCRGLNALLGEQSIRDFAYACDYVPGMFVELVYPKFIEGKDIR